MRRFSLEKGISKKNQLRETTKRKQDSQRLKTEINKVFEKPRDKNLRPREQLKAQQVANCFILLNVQN